MGIAGFDELTVRHGIEIEVQSPVKRSLRESFFDFVASSRCKSIVAKCNDRHDFPDIADANKISKIRIHQCRPKRNRMKQTTSSP